MTRQAHQNPLVHGLRMAITHWRLAGILWFTTLIPVAISWAPLSALTSPIDTSAFREPVLQGWNSYAVAAFVAFQTDQAGMAGLAAGSSLLIGLLLYLFLGSGILRALVQDIPGPSLARVLRESIALFEPTAWAFCRLGLTFVFWAFVLAGGPAGLLLKLAGNDAPPNNLFETAAEYWVVGTGFLVFLNVSLRFDLARVALAKERTPTARGAYRAAKKALKGARGRATGIAALFLLAGGLIQTGFTAAGVLWNPSSVPSLLGLVLFRQTGFFLLAMTRVAFLASLIRWDEIRAEETRPVPLTEAARGDR